MKYSSMLPQNSPQKSEKEQKLTGCEPYGTTCDTVNEHSTEEEEEQFLACITNACLSQKSLYRGTRVMKVFAHDEGSILTIT